MCPIYALSKSVLLMCPLDVSYWCVPDRGFCLLLCSSHIVNLHESFRCVLADYTLCMSSKAFSSMFVSSKAVSYVCHLSLCPLGHIGVS